jgi:hypothetical protein
MSLELFKVIPVKLPSVELKFDINEELDTVYNDRISAFLKLLNIDYNYKEIIKTAISLNKKIILKGKIDKKLTKQVSVSRKPKEASLIGENMDDEDYQEKFKNYLTAATDIPKEALFTNNRIEFLNDIMKKMIGLKFEKDDASCEKTGDKEFKPLVHQLIVTRYLNSFTPYRGLLLYHGLGSGKTCSSISIIEGMKNSHKIYVMTPASLQANYRTQMKFCGNQLFKLNNNWVKIDINQYTDYKEVFNAIGIDENIAINNQEIRQYIRKYNCLWVVKDQSNPNYTGLTEDDKSQIDELIDILIKQKYKFINYNGITKQRWDSYTKDHTNPFDNSVIVIDEVHNFVSRIINKVRSKKKSVSTFMYDAILEAENCKVVALSGTPYINYPDELGILFNIIGGYTYCLEVLIEVTNTSITDKVFKTLLDVPYIESYEYEQQYSKIKIIQNAYGFSKQPNGKVIFDDNSLINRYEFLEKIKLILKDNKYFNVKKLEYVKYKKFPELDFNELFVTADLKINNKEWFQSKITGMVSYLGDKADLMPDIIKTDAGEDIHIVDCFMSPHQISAYSKIRNQERELERNGKKKENDDKTNSTYRVFSRACCNFSFPTDKPRPMPNKDVLKDPKFTEDDLDVVDNESLVTDVDGKYDESDVVNRKIDKTYFQRIEKVLKELYDDASLYFNCDDIPKLLNKQSGVNGENPLKEYSPKFYKLLENIIDDANEGCHLMYTNFRQLEGIGIFSIILQYYGFIELRVEKTGSGGYSLKFNKMYSDADYGDNKKYFSLYTGSETPEEKEIIRNIYNSNFSALPNNIVEEIKEYFPNEQNKNLFGGIIKLLMITASGAEGIDLKNTRFVHITEPYWHHVRINQVIGRARRICSHASLPENLKNVKVFMYISNFGNIDLEQFNALKTQDNSLTTDQSLYEIMERKRALSVMFLDTLKESSIDCVVNYKDKCVQKPFTKLKNNKLYGLDYKMDPIMKFKVKTKEVALVKKTFVIDGVKDTYIVEKDAVPSALYDYNTYIKSSAKGKKPILVKVGTMEDEGVAVLNKN